MRPPSDSHAAGLYFGHTSRSQGVDRNHNERAEIIQMERAAFAVCPIRQSRVPIAILWLAVPDSLNVDAWKRFGSVSVGKSSNEIEAAARSVPRYCRKPT